MLYDNAQLITLYCEAFRYTQNDLYKHTAQHSIDFVLREWQSVEHGFYSALDADSEGEEGKYYVWQTEELSQLLKDDYAVFCDYYCVNDIGYWEHDNYILMRSKEPSAILQKHSLSEKELHEKIATCHAVLIKARDKRVKPGLDNKILTAWNGLMCRALCEAYLTFGDKKYKEIALANASFIKNHLLQKDGSLKRSFSNGHAKIDGFLDDYAFVIDAFIHVYYVSQEETWLNQAIKLSEYALQHFYDEEKGLFYYTAETSEKLAVRTSEVSDNVIPSSNSQMAINLFKLYKITGRESYYSISSLMLGNLNEEIAHYGAGYSNWASLYMDLLNDPAEVCIVGKDVEEKLLSLYKHYLPNAIFVVTASPSELDILKDRYVNDKTLIYVCKNKSCQMPTSVIKEAVELIEKNN